NILTDPIWSERASPLSWIGPRRRRKPGVSWEDLPPIDLVLISHNHYDHMDLPTLRRLAARGGSTFIEHGSADSASVGGPRRFHVHCSCLRGSATSLEEHRTGSRTGLGRVIIPAKLHRTLRSGTALLSPRNLGPQLDAVVRIPD